ncbi:diadenylate cyclase [Methanolobus sp. ZRKC3]|uniref:DNA integrity scanning protein DisA nucleotide-binding domain protein n=1 Tax=Methanolobus sp. ZRKC3 TaxID=3125786 RepID=UPI00324DB793
MENIRIVAHAAVKLAEELGAIAIIVSGDDNFENLDTEIPMYHTSRRTKSVIDHLVATSKGKEDKCKEITDRIMQQAGGKVESIETVSAIELMTGEIKEGLVVGIIETKDSHAIIVHDLTENQLVRSLKECEERIRPDIMRAVLKIAFDISKTGREGKQVGTAFILGDEEEVLLRSHQMILNPYSGHSDEERDVLNRNNWESIKEFAQLDGVFIVSENGRMESAGRYLDVDARDIELDKGLGGRHVSAAAITRDTVSIAVTVSETGGVIHIYMDGKELMNIESTERATCHQNKKIVN